MRKSFLLMVTGLLLLVMPVEAQPVSWIGENLTNYYDHFGVGMAFEGDALAWVGNRRRQHTGDRGAIYVWRTTNNGDTWSINPIYRHPTLDSVDASGGVSSVGTGIIWFYLFDPVTNTSHGMQAWRSTDDALTWELADTNTPAEAIYSPYGGLVELPSGRLLQSFYGWTGTTYRVWTLASDDDGLTWGNETTIVQSSASTYRPTEISIAYIDGTTDATARLIAVARNNSGTMHQYKSLNGGAAWQDMGTISIATAGANDVSPWLFVDDGMLNMLWLDRTAARLKWARMDACVAFTTPAWALVATTAYGGIGTDAGYPSVVDWRGERRWFAAFNNDLFMGTLP